MSKSLTGAKTTLPMNIALSTISAVMSYSLKSGLKLREEVDSNAQSFMAFSRKKMDGILG
jgi:hypothetical protein